MKYLNKYNDIMSRYRTGCFGNENLTLHEILERANDPGLIDNMDLSEIQCLSNGSSGLTKKMFSMLQKDALNTVLVMKKLEKELAGYNIDSYRDSTDSTDEALANRLRLVVAYCGDNELPRDTEAMLCPVDDKSYLGIIKIQKDSAATKFSFRHELIHYFRDVKVGNRVTTEFTRKMKGRTPSDEEQEVNYLTAASIMPIEEVSTKLDQFELITSRDEETVFLSDLAKKYEQAEDVVLRRLVEVRRLVDYAKNIGSFCEAT